MSSWLVVEDEHGFVSHHCTNNLVHIGGSSPTTVTFFDSWLEKAAAVLLLMYTLPYPNTSA